MEQTSNGTVSARRCDQCRAFLLRYKDDYECPDCDVFSIVLQELDGLQIGITRVGGDA